ncbi:MAG: CDP-alcohol phosphatidyltransferase family protein [Patescibacteria group bacterium]|nr:CDP-alcohol phosphatidyltransferase family protein [Patescibacteria group bacterium]
MANRANFVTLLRIIGAVPLFFLILLAPYDHRIKFAALIGLAVVAVTDMVDGRLARSRFGQITDLGKEFDPLADKILVAAIYVPLIHVLATSLLPVLTFIMIFRDTTVSWLRSVAAHHHQTISARSSGKLRTIGSYTLGFVLISRIKVNSVNTDWWLTDWTIGLPFWLFATLIVIMAGFTIYSLCDYLRAAPFLRKIIRNPDFKTP